MKVVKELDAIDVGDATHRRRRIVVLQRDDGHFAFAEEYYYVNEYEGEIVAEGWAQHPSEGLYATAEIAEQEGLAAFVTRHRLRG